MKKILAVLVVCLAIAGCYSENRRDYLKQECKNLEREYSGLISSRNRLSEQISTLNTEIRDLRAERNALKSGRDPRYIVKFEIRQGTFTLDIF
jgi:outer membrane murein-binding lipoprotein Lpp